MVPEGSVSSPPHRAYGDRRERGERNGGEDGRGLGDGERMMKGADEIITEIGKGEATGGK